MMSQGRRKHSKLKSFRHIPVEFPFRAWKIYSKHKSGIFSLNRHENRSRWHFQSSVFHFDCRKHRQTSQQSIKASNVINKFEFKIFAAHLPASA